MANDLVTVWGGVPRIGRAPASNELLIGNGSGFTLQTVAITLDNILGSTQGSIAYRSATQWTQLVPGTANNVLQTNGASVNPSWVTPEVVVNNALGGSDGGIAYKTGGDWSSLSIGAANTIMSSTGSLPAWTTITSAIDNGTTGSPTLGNLIYRAATSYEKLTIGAANTILASFNPGSGNIPAWKTVSELFDSYFSGYGVGSIITRDRNPPNGSGLWGALTIGATNTLLTSASATGGNLPQWTTLSSAIDNGAAGTTFLGSMLYAASGGWQKLNIGQSGYFLSSNGTAPVWSKSFTLKNKTSDEAITSSASYANDSDLQFSVEANSVYSFTGNVAYLFTTSGYEFAVNGPSGATVYVETLYNININSTTLFDTSVASNTGAVSNTISSVFFRGYLYTAATAGTFSVRNKLQNGSTTSYSRAGSFIEYAKAG
jgi:hypothetical protein